MGGGDDHLTLDFSNIGSLTMNGGTGTDILSVGGLASGDSITTANVANISHIETFDISSIDLSSSNLTIDFNALWNLSTSSDLAPVGGYNTLNLDVSGTDTTQLTIAGMTSAAFTTTGSPLAESAPAAYADPFPIWLRAAALHI